MRRAVVLAVAAACAACTVVARAETAPVDDAMLWPREEAVSAEVEALDQSSVASERMYPTEPRWRILSAALSMGAPDAPSAVDWTHEAAAIVSVISLDHVRVEATWSRSLPVPVVDKDVRWELCAVHQDGEPVGVASSAAVARVIASTPMDGDASDKDDDQRGERADTEEDAGGLECELDVAFCVPELRAIRLLNLTQEKEDLQEDSNHGSQYSLGANHSIAFEFSQPTNRPTASTTADIRAVLAISKYIGDNLTGSWSADGRVLTLTVLETDESKATPTRELLAGLQSTKAVYRSRQKGAVSPRRPLKVVRHRVSLSLALSFRIERAGSYFVRIYEVDGESAAFEATAAWSFRSPVFTVRASEESHVVLADRSRTSDAASTSHVHHMELQAPAELPDDSSLTRPSLFLPGVITYGGGEGVVIPESAIQPPTAASLGSWSLSFWAFLTEDATGSFRTLFFHGDGTLEQRTPSAWWKPDERRLVLRVSTATDPDVGLDSRQTLPLREWIHLGFSFHNCSDSALGDSDDACPTPGAETASWQYVAEFFVNGELDQRVRIHDTVARNVGPLHVGKGPWTPGMKGFSSNLRIFSSPLPREEHRQRFLLEKQSHPSFFELLDGGHDGLVMSKAAKTPASQIAYLFQRVMTAIAPSKPVEDEQARQLAAHCDASAWDRLSELAELGDVDALRTVGKTLLYGSWVDEVDVSGCLSVAPNASGAASLLLRALQSGDASSARYLALALEIGNAGRQVAGEATDLLTALPMFRPGLYHAAAAAGSKAAFALLGNVYRDAGDPLVAAAAHHYFHAARDASVAFHERGKQPLHEMDRLYDFVDAEGREDLSARGQRGEDDELIQLQQMRADQHGDVAAMAAMGDLYYWGARGLPRDHARALRYFERAAHAGNADAQCAVANMLLRGEGGVGQDNATAVAWYKRAADAENHPRALNGLGFMHFHGSSGVEENKTRALELFERAANEQRDGDSLFNAGFCYAKGIGTAGGRPNMTRAIELFDTAARKFGHFDSVMELAETWMRGVALQQSSPGADGGSLESVEVIDADWTRALPYVKAASDAGRWGGKMRAGFTRFLANDWARAIAQYHDAAAFGGYPLATSNLAFLYDLLLDREGDASADAASRHQRERRALEYLLRAHELNGDREVLVRIGDFHFQGLAGLPVNPREAVDWYSRASARGDPQGAYNVGFMYETGVGGVGVNLLRARRYFERAAELAAAANRGPFAALPARLALVRVTAREWVHGSPIAQGLIDQLDSMLSMWPSSSGAHALADQERSVAILSSAVGLTAIAGVVMAVMVRRHLQFMWST